MSKIACARESRFGRKCLHFFESYKIGPMWARDLIYFLKWPSWALLLCNMNFWLIFWPWTLQKSSQSRNFNFSEFLILQLLDFNSGLKISANIAARNKIKAIFYTRMNRGNGIYQITLVWAEWKMKGQPYLRQETFLLFHPLNIRFTIWA